ncbi:MAG: long-chain fatty acid--CoA ligase [Albidovulum sp.]|uniref:AMP-binding protein n=1 Tax=Albidovulum sp. TaxID=1872424 RepID=UPI0013252097|nr:AMP-binding protein [Defluviimonas sp.]KAB2886533.1 MAG: long-chain fatty acid--CoA ligase [Defluviimonas sp.]
MNTGTFLTKAARFNPSKIALVDSGMTLRYDEMNARSAAFAAGLRRRGYAAGDRVVLFMPNRADYIVALFALFKGGLVAVPANAKLHTSELGFIAGHCGARGVVCSRKSRAVVEEALAGMSGIDLIDTDSEGADSFQAIVDDGLDHRAEDAEVAPDDLAWIFYTSGTTGRPKGAMLTHRNLCAMTMNALADVCDFQPEDVVLHVAPLSHGSGLYALPSIARGATNLIYAGGSFDAADVLATIARERVTILAFVAPTMIHMLLETNPALKVPTLRRVPYGGAPIDPGLAEAAMARFGPIFAQLYGQGESPMTISALRPRDHHGRVLFSAGTVRTDVEVRLVDESGQPVVDGAEGEICVRGDVVMRGYWNDAAADAKALKDGWLHTGDVGRFEDGYLYLLSRMNDVIISGGSNIYPREIEDVLMLHPAVREVCVFGEPDGKWGESVTAAVVASGPVAAEDLQEFCRQHIASFKKPKRIAFVEFLPKNAYGKIVRREVKASLSGG